METAAPPKMIDQDAEVVMIATIRTLLAMSSSGILTRISADACLDSVRKWATDMPGTTMKLILAPVTVVPVKTVVRAVGAGPRTMLQERTRSKLCAGANQHRRIGSLKIASSLAMIVVTPTMPSAAPTVTDADLTGEISQVQTVTVSAGALVGRFAKLFGAKRHVPAMQASVVPTAEIAASPGNKPTLMVQPSIADAKIGMESEPATFMLTS